jgi:uncharacterized protein
VSEHGFEWDEDKAAENLKKHDVPFDEAATVFADPGRIEIFDVVHSEDEGRYSVVGLSRKGRLLFVAFTPREAKIRIIHARLANRQMEQDYEKAN